MKGLILAGGLSERMGQSKGLILFEGNTLVERAYDQLAKVVEDVYVSLRPEQVDSFSFLKLRGISILEDQMTAIGPAAALLRAHQEFLDEDWFVLACDFPRADPEDIQKMAAAYHADQTAEVICYQNSKKISEPLFAIWRKSALQKLAKNVSAENFGPQFTLKDCSRNEMNVTHERSLFNANTPEDLGALKLAP